MRRTSTTALLAALALLLAACGGGGGDGDGAKPTVRLGTADFTEQLILGQVYRQALEAAGYQVEYKEALGARQVINPALASGELNMVIEYAGSVLIQLAKEEPSRDLEELHRQVTEFYQPKGLRTLPLLPLRDEQAVGVTRQTADRYGLETISDLNKVQERLVMAGPPECRESGTCYRGMRDAYGLDSLEFKPVQIGLRYQALRSGEAQVIVAFTTEAQIAREGIVILEDDKGVFPPDPAVPVVRADLLEQGGPAFRDLVNKVGARLTTEEITELNAKVDIDREDPEDVAREWLEQNGLR